ncbi:MAG: pyridoxal phosphate-dependent aminotransferase [Gammaproteobacteria bacterium]|jgi:aspartate aminotransferase
MKIELSKLVNRIAPSPTMMLSGRANELKAQGKDIISLSVGEPDFDTPEFIKEAARRALADGKTKYTPVAGIPSLRQAVADKFVRENNLKYKPEQIIISAGAKQCIFNACMALLNPGDEVIIPAPYWVSYPDIVKITDAVPVFIPTNIEQKYKITAEQLKQAITKKTRLIILNSPSNPSGTIYSKEELKALAEVLLANPGIYIITDDIYEHIAFRSEPFCNIVNVCPELYERTVVVNGPSKAYAMTGWRIGYAASPAEITNAMQKIQSQSTSCACSIAQVATEAALTGDQTCIKTMLQAFKQRHDYVFETLSSINGVEVTPSDGTFYTFPNMQAIIDNAKGIKTDIELSDHLLTEAHVAITPGTAFGLPGSMRISYAVDMDNLSNALNRLKLFIDQII